MVGMARFERATPASRTQCPTKLGHIPTHILNNQFGGECPSLFSGTEEKRFILISRLEETESLVVFLWPSW
jgi:hypothetical protein